MRARGCCHADEARIVGGGPRLRSAKAAGWVAPSAVMVLMPKCPACVVAYVAIVTGAGISVSAAEHLRLAVLVMCAATLVWLISRELMRRVRSC